MNADTGELKRFSDDYMKLKDLANGFQTVPDSLVPLADQLLGEKESVVVDEGHELRQHMGRLMANAQNSKRYHKRMLMVRE